MSDFTVCDALGVEVAGAAFPHRLYQFALAHSGWRHAEVSLGGESFMTLSGGLQAALWRLGGVPEEHRTDSLSAAFNNLTKQEMLTCCYDALCRHYGMQASRCNPGQSHENSSIESRHDSLKTALDQALRLRDSCAFDERAVYEAFVEQIVQRLNAWATTRLGIERLLLRSLPARRIADCEELPARVSKYAIFTVKGVQYSAPSQLIGYRLTARLYAQHIECWLAGWVRVQASPCDARRQPALPARHRLSALCSRPALPSPARSRAGLRDAVFPHDVYRQTWERLAAAWPERQACKAMVGLLVLAADGHEAQLAGELEQLIELDQLPDVQALSRLLAPLTGEVADVAVELPSLVGYDQLLAAGEVCL